MGVMGKIIKTEECYAYVEIIRKSACESCHLCENRGVCHSEILFSESLKKLVVKADNHVCGQVGDYVDVVSSGEVKVNALSAFIFVVPIFIFAAVYFLLGFLNIDTEWLKFLLAGVFSLIMFLCFLKISDRYCKKNISYWVSEIKND